MSVARKFLASPALPTPTDGPDTGFTSPRLVAALLGHFLALALASPRLALDIVVYIMIYSGKDGLMMKVVYFFH